MKLREKRAEVKNGSPLRGLPFFMFFLSIVLMNKFSEQIIHYFLAFSKKFNL
jgi:hypothetical protein